MAGTVVIGVIAPHGDLAIAEACAEDERDLAVATQRAMAQMAARVAAARPEAVVVATPHNLHVVGHMAVVTAARLGGGIEGASDPLPMVVDVDRELALAVREAMGDAGIPTVAVSFGGNVVEESQAPLDWGAHIPLWHVGRAIPDLPTVVLAPARDLAPAAHVEAGRAIARAAVSTGRRIAFVASADQGHGHRADGPYGFTPASAAFDARVVELVERNALEALLDITAEEAGEAKADSWWQMLMLHGALEEDGASFDAELLAYEAPTYYGMLTAVFEPRP